MHEAVASVGPYWLTNRASGSASCHWRRQLHGITEPEKHTLRRCCGTLHSNAPSAAGTVSAETLQPTAVTPLSFMYSNRRSGDMKSSFGMMAVVAPKRSGR